MPTAIPYGNLNKLNAINLRLSPSSVAATTTAEQSFTLPGVNIGDLVVGVIKPTFQAGLAVTPGRVTAANTLTLVFSNPTAAPIVPTALELYTILIARPEGAPNAGQMS